MDDWIRRVSGLDDVNLHFIRNLDDIFAFKEWLGNRRPYDAIAFDTETDGFDRYNGKVRLIQFGDHTDGWAFDRDEWQGLARWVFEDFTGDFIGHNISFDTSFIANSCNIHVPRDRSHCTMIMSALLEPHLSKALKNQATRHVDPAAAGLQDILKGTNFTWATVPTSYGPYWQYGALDPVLTYHLFMHHQPLVAAQCQRGYEIEMAVLWVTEKMSQNGTYIDRSFAERYLREFSDYCDSIEAWCQREYGIKPGSNAAIVAILQEAGFSFTKATASGAIALDKEVLDGIDHPLAQAVLGRRQAQKMASTYLTHYVEHADAQSLIHPTFNTVGARTGRMSCSDPNLQNLPRLGTTKFGDVVRNCIKSRWTNEQMWDPDGRASRNLFTRGGLIMCDFDQIEMRVLAHLADEQAMIDAFKGQDDFFVTLSRQVFQDDTITKKDKRRQITKNACVPLSTQILTRDGWRKHNEIVIGDETLGLNPETRKLEWTKITAIHHYNDSEVVHFGNRERSFEVTPNHRWAVEHTFTKNISYLETHQIQRSSRHNVLLAAELSDHDGLPITLAEATVLGWALGDGSIKQGTFTGAPAQGKSGQRIKCSMTIGQIKPQWIEEIDDLLRDIPHKRYVSKQRTVSGLTGVTWVLNPEWARDLLRRIDMWQKPFDPWKFATSLSTEQRQAVIAALNAAEGANVTYINMSQSADSPITELMIALGYLSGHFTRVYHREPDGRGWTKKAGVAINYQTSFMGPQKTTITPSSRQDVWCVTTELGTWTMRQGDTPTLTGNSYAKIYFAGVQKFAKTAGIPVPQARDFLQRFDTLYPNVPRFSQSVLDTAMTRRNEEGTAYVRSPLTGRLHVGDPRKEYALINYLIQGMAAEINKMKLIELDAAGLGDYMFATVHDEVLLDVPAHVVPDAIQTLDAVMNDDELLSVPITAGISIGERWGKKVDYEVTP